MPALPRTHVLALTHRADLALSLTHLLILIAIDYRPCFPSPSPMRFPSYSLSPLPMHSFTHSHALLDLPWLIAGNLLSGWLVNLPFP